MTHPSYDFGDVDAFTTGTVGAPGQRIFFLQVRADGRVLTLKCEKQQVAALGQYLERLLDDLPAPEDAPLPTALELTEPAESAWLVGQLAVAWEADRDRFVVVVEEMAELSDDPDDPEAPLVPDPLDPESLRRLVPDVADHDVYLCGPTGMMQAAERALRHLGLPARQIHAERFAY